MSFSLEADSVVDMIPTAVINSLGDESSNLSDDSSEGMVSATVFLDTTTRFTGAGHADRTIHLNLNATELPDQSVAMQGVSSLDTSQDGAFRTVRFDLNATSQLPEQSVAMQEVTSHDATFDRTIHMNLNATELPDQSVAMQEATCIGDTPFDGNAHRTIHKNMNATELPDQSVAMQEVTNLDISRGGAFRTVRFDLDATSQLPEQSAAMQEATRFEESSAINTTDFDSTDFDSTDLDSTVNAPQLPEQSVAMQEATIHFEERSTVVDDVDSSKPTTILDSIETTTIQDQLLSLRQMMRSMRELTLPVVFADDEPKQLLFEKCVLSPIVARIRQETDQLRALLADRIFVLEQKKDAARTVRERPAASTKRLLQIVYQREFLCSLDQTLASSLSPGFSSIGLGEQAEALQHDIDILQSRTPPPSVQHTCMPSDVTKLIAQMHRHSKIHRWRIRSVRSDSLVIYFPATGRDYDLEISWNAPPRAVITAGPPKTDDHWWEVFLPLQRLEDIAEAWSPGTAVGRSTSQLIHQVCFELFQAERSFHTCTQS